MHTGLARALRSASNGYKAIAWSTIPWTSVYISLGIQAGNKAISPYYFLSEANFRSDSSTFSGCSFAELRLILNLNNNRFRMKTTYIQCSLSIFQSYFHFQIEKLLSDGGGVQKSYLSSAVTLCLAGIGADDNELQGCIDVNELPVVNLEWVRQSVRSVKVSAKDSEMNFFPSRNSSSVK